MLNTQDLIISETKICTSCFQELPLTKYKRRSGRQSGQLTSMCARCLYVKYTRPNTNKKTKIVRDYKLKYGCTDCGYNTHPEALEFDHIKGEKKSFNIGSKIGSYSIDLIMKEISKCEVVCANCHAIRTSDRRELVTL